MSPTGDLHVTSIFLGEEVALSLLKPSCVLPWPGTLLGAARPLTPVSTSWKILPGPRLPLVFLVSCWLMLVTARKRRVNCWISACWPQDVCFVLRTPLHNHACPFCMSASSQICEPASQCSLHSEPIFRLLLKVAVNGTHQCESLNFCGTVCPNPSVAVINQCGHANECMHECKMNKLRTLCVGVVTELHSHRISESTHSTPNDLFWLCTCLPHFSLYPCGRGNSAISDA